MIKKWVFCFVLCIFLVGMNVSALPIEEERNESNHYGVNKHWKITNKNKNNILSTPYVDASKKIYDYAEVLTEADEVDLYHDIQNFIEKTNMDIVIVTIDQSYTNDSYHEDYAADFYDYNDFGIAIEHYSGVLLLRNVYMNDPYYNVYMFGDAQLYFSSARADRMLDHIYPELKVKNHLNGFKMFIDDYLTYYNNGIPKEMKKYSVNDDGYLFQKFRPPYLVAFLISGVVTGIVMGILIGKNKMVRKEKLASEYLKKDTINFTDRRDVFLRSHTSSYTISSSSSGSSGGGFSSSSGSSGGGHSSGGGRHG